MCYILTVLRMIMCVFILCIPYLYCQTLSSEEVLRLNASVSNIEKLFGKDSQHVVEIADRVAFLSLAATKYNRDMIDRLVVDKRADLLCLALVQLAAPRYGHYDSDYESDVYISRLLNAIRRIDERKALPYLVYSADCLRSITIRYSDREMSRTVMNYQLDAALRQFSCGEGESPPPILDDLGALPEEEIERLRTVGFAGIDKEVIGRARDFLAKNPDIADGWRSEGEVFAVPAHVGGDGKK